LLFADAIAAAMGDDGLDVAGSVRDGAGAIEFLERESVDVVLMDIGLPDRSGLAVARDILERWPETKVLAVTALDDPRAADDAMRMGFAGYVTKDTSVERFTASVRAVMEGQVVLPRRLVSGGRQVDMSDGFALLVDQLTPREHEVLALLVQGADGGEIARRLGISRNTVRTHVQSILTKLQVHSRLEAATLAVRHRLVPVPYPGSTDDAAVG
jgi:two-component system, NarL family, nitrate/nitrite response regulator NarL